jgi:hypothetical protein
VHPRRHPRFTPNLDLNMRAHVAPRVPPEITDAIIHLSQDEESLLATCSHVCKAWVPASRCHLFGRLSLDALNIHGFHNLSLSPHFTIARYTRILMVDLWCKGYVEQFQISLLPILPVVQIFTLHNTKLPRGNHWHTVSITPEMQTKLCEKLQTVTTLVLVDLQFDSSRSFANLMHAFPLTRYLDLSNLYFDFPPIPRDLHLSLQSLSIEYCYTPWLLTWLQSRPVPVVHTLSLGPTEYREQENEEYSLASEALISLFAESLENISIDYDIMYRIQSSSSMPTSFRLHLLLTYILVDVSPAVKLRTVLLQYKTQDHTLSAEWINNLVTRLKSPYIKEMIIRFYQDTSKPEKCKIRELEELDKLLSQPPFLDLRKLEFLVPAWTWEVQRMIKVQMPMCHSRGILHITWDTKALEYVQDFWRKYKYFGAIA